MIERTIKRLLKGISILIPVKHLQNLIEGFAVEFYRFIDFKDEILRSVVPNVNMSTQSISDYNKMFGIPNSLSGTNSEKIARIIEKSDITGFPGKDWLQDQVRNAGFDLYVIEQTIQSTSFRQWGDFQFAESLQLGLTERFLNPGTVPGILIVNQPYGGFGKIYETQYAPGTLTVYTSMYGDIQYGEEQEGTIFETTYTQYGTSGLQYGTPDLNQTYPRALEYTVTSLPAGWGFYFFLSPFADRLATDLELLQISTDEYTYLRQLVISSKLVRNWCIAQVEVV